MSKLDEKKIFQDMVIKDLSSVNLMRSITEKISSQWKTIRKAFSDINKDLDADGYISEKELKFYLNHWGYKLSEKEFADVYNMFDVDGDGRISYNDFHKSAGPEILPGETLYFRQDKN